MIVRVIARDESMSTYFEDVEIEETETDMIFYYGDEESSKVRKNKIMKIIVPLDISSLEALEWDVKNGWRIIKEIKNE